MDMTFSKNMRKLRLEKNWTQEQAAERLGISAKAVSRWETGATFPDVLMLPEIAKLYGVLVDDLFRESARGYENFAARLLAVFERTRKAEDFWNAYQEYDRLFAKGAPTADDYRRCGILHECMMCRCKDEALAFYDRTMELCEGTDAELYYRAKGQKILLRSKVGEGRACVEEQEQTVEECPENPEEWGCLLHAYLESGQIEEGARAFERAIAKFPENALLYVCGGDIYRQRKEYEKAFRYWEKSWEIDHRYADALFSIAFCYEELGKYKEAYEVWNRIICNLTQRGLSEEAVWPKEMAEKCRGKILGG